MKSSFHRYSLLPLLFFAPSNEQVMCNAYEQSAFASGTEQPDEKNAFPDETSSELLTRWKTSSDLGEINAIRKELVRRLEEKDIHDIFLGFNGHAYTLGEEDISLEHFLMYTDAPLLLNNQSPVYDKLADMLGTHSSLFQENVNWIFMSPVVYYPMGNVKSIIDGTVTEDKAMGVRVSPRESLNGYFLGILVHEAQHAANKNQQKKLSRLQDERSAYAEQCTFLWMYLKSTEEDTAKSSLEFACEHVLVADYLLQERFGDYFKNVYPSSKIFARELIWANIAKETLEKYLDVCTGDKEQDIEFRTAARIAYQFQTEEPRQFAQELYTLYSNGSGLERENAVAVLQYLYPQQIGGNPLDQYPSTEKTLPPLETLFAPVPDNPLQPQTEIKTAPEDLPVTIDSLVDPWTGSQLLEDSIYPFPEQDVHIRAYVQEQMHMLFYNRDRNIQDAQAMLTDLNRTKAFFEGDPDGDNSLWTFVGEDLVERGPFDSSMMYVIPSTKLSNGQILSKVDYYKNEKYVTTSWRLQDTCDSTDL